MTIVKQQAPPVEPPPPTYDILGLTEQEAKDLRRLFRGIEWEASATTSDFGKRIGTLVYQLFRDLPKYAECELAPRAAISYHNLIRFPADVGPQEKLPKEYGG